MKVLCKKSYIIHSDGTELYTEGFWYNVRYSTKFHNGKVIAVETNLPLTFADYYFALEPNENDGYKFKEYFFTKREIRKQKLIKLNENILNLMK